MVRSEAKAPPSFETNMLQLAMPEPFPSLPDQFSMNVAGLNVGRAATRLIGGAASTIVVA